MIEECQCLAERKEEWEIHFHTKLLETLGHRGLSEVTEEEIKRCCMYADLKMSDRLNQEVENQS